MACSVLVQTRDGPMDVYLDEPSPGLGPRARVVLMFPRSGLDGFPQRVARWLAQNGHPVYVPDITHRCPADMPIRDRKAHLEDEEIVRDVGALVDWIDSRSDAEKRTLAIMGHCMGGRNSLLCASATGRFDGAIAFYSGDMMEGWGRELSPLDQLAALNCPVLGFFGGHDKNPSPADVDRIEATLTRLGVPHRIHRYADVGHAFQQNRDRSPQESRAAAHSDTEALAFLHGLHMRAPA